MVLSLWPYCYPLRQTNKKFMPPLHAHLSCFFPHALSISQRFLGVSWTPPGHNGGSKVSFYTLEVAQSAPCACGGCPPLSSPDASPGALSRRGGTRQHQPCESTLEGNSVQMNLSADMFTAEIRDLTPGTPYFFRVAANNTLVSVDFWWQK